MTTSLWSLVPVVVEVLLLLLLMWMMMIKACRAASRCVSSGPELGLTRSISTWCAHSFAASAPCFCRRTLAVPPLLMMMMTMTTFFRWKQVPSELYDRGSIKARARAFRLVATGSFTAIVRSASVSSSAHDAVTDRIVRATLWNGDDTHSSLSADSRRPMMHRGYVRPCRVLLNMLGMTMPSR